MTDEPQSETRTVLNEIFKQVVVGRDWKAHASDVYELYRSSDHQREVVKSLESIVMKILVIPAGQQKSASELVAIFIRVYETLLKQARTKNDPDSTIYKLLNEHIETAFKLTERTELHYKNRAYQWLETLIEIAPLDFWNDRKKRVVKSIYTHAVDVVKSDLTVPQSSEELAKHMHLLGEPYKELALRISLRFLAIVKHRGFEEYEQAIRSNMLQVLAEDRREAFRRLVIEKLDFGNKPECVAFIARKTQDTATSVRLACYKRLAEDCIPISTFSKLERLNLVINGLRDPDQLVLETCRVYLIQQFCVTSEHQRHDLATESLQVDWLKPIDEILHVLKVSSTWDSVKLSDCIKLLFREIILPAYGAFPPTQQAADFTDRFQEHFKSTFWPSLDGEVDLSKRGLAHLFSQLVLVHAYVHTKFETQQSSDDADDQVLEEPKKWLPPLFRLEKILRDCTDVIKMGEKCSKASDFAMALTYARLACFQALKLLWFAAVYHQGQMQIHLNRIQGLLVKKREESEQQVGDEGDTVDNQDSQAHAKADLKAKADECKSTLDAITAILLDFCAKKDFFEAGRSQSIKVDQLSEFSQQMKRVGNDLVFIEGNDELLREALLIMKKSDQMYQQKVLSMMEELGTNDFDHLFQRVRLLKAVLKVSKLGQNAAVKSDTETFQLHDQLEKEVKMCLQATTELEQQPSIDKEQNDSAEYAAKEPLEPQVQKKLILLKTGTIEILSLLMVLDAAKFDLYLDMVIRSIEEERPEPRKSQQVMHMLKAIFDGLIVHSYMLKTSPVCDKTTQDAFEKRKLKLRQLLLKQLRDADLNVRFIATEGFCRLLMCEAADKPIDFISRLMLIGFEKVTEIAGQSLSGQEQETQKAIQGTVEQFLNHFVRLSKSRCKAIAIATTQTASFLLKAKSERSPTVDQGFLQINLFYLFGIITDLLKYDYNKDFAIFDFGDSRRPTSFQLHFFEFFTLSLINRMGNVPHEEDTKMTTFIVDSLDFLHLDELPGVLREGMFEHTYETLLVPLFSLLYQKLVLFQYPGKMMHKVKKTWTLCAFLFLQARQNFTQSGQSGQGPRNEDEMRTLLDQHIRVKIQALAQQLPSKQSMKELSERLTSRKNCDVARLDDICANFYQSMLQYKHEFSEQKSTLADEADLKRKAASDLQKTLGRHSAPGEQPPSVIGISGGANMVDSKREAEKLIKSKASSYTTVKKKISNLIEILGEDSGSAVGSSGAPTVQGKAESGRKRDKKRIGKNQGAQAARTSSYAATPTPPQKPQKRQKTN